MARGSSVDDKSAQKIWSVLKNAFKEIFEANEGTLSFEELYRSAYHLVLYKHGDMLYDGVREEIKANLNVLVDTISKNEKTADSDHEFLKDLTQKWEYYVLRIKMIKDVLMYMDRSYVPPNSKVPVYDLGLTLYHDQVIKAKLKTQVIKSVLGLIQQERNGNLIDREVLKKILKMLVDLGLTSQKVYQELFQKPFIAETTAFYKSEAESSINQLTIAEYLMQVEKRIAEEKRRVSNYLEKSTEPALAEALNSELISKHAKTIVFHDTGSLLMFKNHSLEDLARMYRVLKRVPETLEDLKNSFLEFVKTGGTKLVEDHPDDKKAL